MHTDRLLSMCGDGRRALVIVNSCDNHSPIERAEKVEGEFTSLRTLGFQPEELDLRDHFWDEDVTQLTRCLLAADLVWVRGGNIFVLLRAMRCSRLDKILPDLLAQDVFVYGGYSAGIDLLARDVHGVEMVDDPYQVPTGYHEEIVWQGLDILPFAVAPHYRSDHPESADIEKLVQYYIDHHIPFVALRDGEVIVHEGSSPWSVLGLR
ncbi:Type 1 glutamine amidotransferase-like domain-containing protein [Nostoc sp. 'Peltigera membranacea cyanobiont' 210A]|uniref:Type 1 glutamine amidotransferase-like domain-containing protein n=1 Tax=Nostoc sp. 'Peltigera membranacea cyanobiont' 210A TaxID=2014529 RepID=UPI001CB9B1E5|nr:Type 1 glutamine amidotransferase-like domain-containing protein [Nostoc sp. 'Peltigera membranacea cyanobiont' 210A]